MPSSVAGSWPDVAEAPSRPAGTPGSQAFLAIALVFFLGVFVGIGIGLVL
jgi:hypothetical protein